MIYIFFSIEGTQYLFGVNKRLRRDLLETDKLQMLTYESDNFLTWPALDITAIVLFLSIAVASGRTVNGRTGRRLIHRPVVLQTPIGWLQHGFFRIQVPFLTRWWNKPTVIRIATRGQSCYAMAGFKRFSHLYENLLLDYDTSNLK